MLRSNQAVDRVATLLGKSVEEVNEIDALREFHKVVGECIVDFHINTNESMWRRMTPILNIWVSVMLEAVDYIVPESTKARSQLKMLLVASEVDVGDRVAVEYSKADDGTIQEHFGTVSNVSEAFRGTVQVVFDKEEHDVDTCDGGFAVKKQAPFDPANLLTIVDTGLEREPPFHLKLSCPSPNALVALEEVEQTVLFLIDHLRDFPMIANASLRLEKYLAVLSQDLEVARGYLVNVWPPHHALRQGQKVRAVDRGGALYHAVIREATHDMVLVSFRGWAPKYDEWIRREEWCSRIQALPPPALPGNLKSEPPSPVPPRTCVHDSSESSSSDGEEVEADSDEGREEGAEDSWARGSPPPAQAAGVARALAGGPAAAEGLGGDSVGAASTGDSDGAVAGGPRPTKRRRVARKGGSAAPGEGFKLTAVRVAGGACPSHDAQAQGVDGGAGASPSLSSTGNLKSAAPAAAYILRRHQEINMAHE